MCAGRGVGTGGSWCVCAGRVVGHGGQHLCECPSLKKKTQEQVPRHVTRASGHYGIKPPLQGGGWGVHMHGGVAYGAGGGSW